MENLVEINICRLCLSSVTHESCDIIDKYAKDMLSVCMSKWVKKFPIDNLDEGKHLICNDCSTKLSAALDFKRTCANTEDCLFPYVNSEKGATLDLREIYLKENDSKLSISDIQNVCRFCMQLIFGECKHLEQLDLNMLSTFIPEINFSSTKNPVICETCYQTFKYLNVFLTTCLENGKEVGYESDGIGYVKTEEVELKPEEIYLKSEENDNSDLEEEQEIEEEYNFEINNPEKLESQQLQRIPTKVIRRVQIYKCEKCIFQTKHAYNLKRHLLTHKDPSELQMYKCGKCSFETRHKHCLGTHKLSHRDPSEIQMHECDQCGFKTRHKSSLRCHKLRHRNLSEIQMYKCADCSYKARHERDLCVHMLLHRGPSEVQMFKCDECSYQTKRKFNLHIHMVKHGDPSEREMYKCEKCARQYKRKKNLKYHKLKGCVDGRIIRLKCDSPTRTSSTDIG